MRKLTPAGGNKKGRQTSPSFEQAHLISLSCALSFSSKSLKAKSFVSPYPTTVLASLTYCLAEERAIGHPSTERTRCEPQPSATKSATSLPDRSEERRVGKEGRCREGRVVLHEDVA